MTKFNRFYVCLLFTSLFIANTPTAQADMQQQSYGNMAYTPVTKVYEPQQQSSYGEKIGNKALNSIANLITSPLELPKNIINTVNQGNLFYGVIGGVFKGLVNTFGRAGVGLVDLITFPLPTKPIVHPLYIWDDFDMDTTYGEVFRLDKTQKIDKPVTQTPVPQPIPIAVATPPKTAVVNPSSQDYQEVNRKLNMLFDKEMQK